MSLVAATIFNNPSHLSCVIRYLLIILLITDLEIHMGIQMELLVTIRFALTKLPTKYVIIRIHFLHSYEEEMFNFAVQVYNLVICSL